MYKIIMQEAIKSSGKVKEKKKKKKKKKKRHLKTVATTAKS
jgi:hypothetical protein